MRDTTYYVVDSMLPSLYPAMTIETCSPVHEKTWVSQNGSDPLCCVLLEVCMIPPNTRNCLFAERSESGAQTRG